MIDDLNNTPLDFPPRPLLPAWSLSGKRSGSMACTSTSEDYPTRKDNADEFMDNIITREVLRRLPVSTHKNARRPFSLQLKVSAQAASRSLRRRKTTRGARFISMRSSSGRSCAASLHPVRLSEDPCSKFEKNFGGANATDTPSVNHITAFDGDGIRRVLPLPDGAILRYRSYLQYRQFRASPRTAQRSLTRMLTFLSHFARSV